MYWSGLSIIRWQSSGSLVALRNDFTSCGPRVMLGTKCPSITSTWMTVPPPSAARPTCSPSRAKSADKIEGASSINLGLSGKRIQGNSNTCGICDRRNLDGAVADHHACSAFYLAVCTERRNDHQVNVGCEPATSLSA